MTEPATPPPVKDPSNTWNMLCHLTALAGLVGIPFGNVLGPLIIWLIKKDEFPSVDAHGKASLNFQISMSIYMFVSSLLIFIVVGIIGVIVLAIIDLVCLVKASMKANEGELYEYPMTIQFLK